MLFRERQLYGKGLSVVQNCYALAGKQSVAAVEVAQSDTCAILLHFGCYLIGNHNAIALYTNLDVERSAAGYGVVLHRILNQRLE